MEMEISMAVVLLSSTCKADPVPWPITVLTYFGYFTTAAVIGLPVINTFFKVWQMKAVGDLRGEPLVASLLCYICSLFLSLMKNNWEFSDTAWINLTGTIVYSIYLCLFFKYAQTAHRTMWWILASAAYIILVVVAGLVAKSIETVKWMYMLAGLASACTPLGLVLFVLEQHLRNLPDSLSSTIGIINYSIWVVLASFPTQDYYDIVQNGAGVLCSLILLVLLLLRWKNEAEPAAGLEEGLNEPLIANQHVIVHVEAITHAASIDEGPAGAKDDDTQADAEPTAVNQAQPIEAKQAQAGANDEGEAGAIDEAKAIDEGQAGVKDEAEAGAQPGAIIETQVGAANQAQAGANNQGQADAVHEADAIDEGQADANLPNPQLRKRRRSVPQAAEKVPVLRRASY